MTSPLAERFSKSSTQYADSAYAICKGPKRTSNSCDVTSQETAERLLCWKAHVHRPLKGGSEHPKVKSAVMSKPFPLLYSHFFLLPVTLMITCPPPGPVPVPEAPAPEEQRVTVIEEVDVDGDNLVIALTPLRSSLLGNLQRLTLVPFPFLPPSRLADEAPPTNQRKQPHHLFFIYYPSRAQLSHRPKQRTWHSTLQADAAQHHQQQQQQQHLQVAQELDGERGRGDERREESRAEEGGGRVGGRELKDDSDSGSGSSEARNRNAGSLSM
ncbi:hypothetical protein AXG93_653s1030 [Marchantia polymorpha subsp. ruderalis]|uniref:Uncharacterized protein n=1 Tax=Marchantia polymorpha subsp. ruderalis TaxID=1480154 RepID=A0A176VT22_MARPO|nr:hypothetical protein AXG93_653s1030 [Marchantia polymorpha subsp. ruderalis]